MSKRTATEQQTPAANSNKRPFGTTPKVAEEDGMGEFEDGWEDEYESDEEVVDGEKDDGKSARGVCDLLMQSICP